MTFRSIAVLVPTRGRCARVGRLLGSLIDTIPPGSRVELCFRIDDDDPASYALLMDDDWPEGFPAAVSVVVGPRFDGYKSLPIFFNELALVARSDLLLLGNDDMLFRTANWPALILAAANQYPDGVFDFGVSTLNEGVYPFSVISRRAAKAMGGVHDPRLFWGDVYLRDVMRAFDRAFPLPAVRIDHEWMGYTPDRTFADAHQENPEVWSDAYWIRHRACVADAVERLRPLLTIAEACA